LNLINGSDHQQYSSFLMVAEIDYVLCVLLLKASDLNHMGYYFFDFME